MAEPKTANDTEDIQDNGFKIDVPRSPSKADVSSKSVLENVAKSQLYQWLQVQGIPTPGRSAMYTQTIRAQYPLLQFNDEMYSEWLTEIAAVYRRKHPPPHNDDKPMDTTESDTKQAESKSPEQVDPDPEWLSLQDGTVDDVLLKQYKIEKLSVTDRCLGCILGVFAVDALGAPYEGWPYENIIGHVASERGVINMVPGTHMGARNKGPRCGMYTDDTMTTLALALSIVENQKLLAQHVAQNYYNFWKSNTLYRGLPDSAQKVLNDVNEGMSISITGRQSFADGSYANGGAMRISPVGLAYRNADVAVLKQAVTDAIMSSHCHPQSIDGALCMALMVQYALKCGANHPFDGKQLVPMLLKNVSTPEMKSAIEIVYNGWIQFQNQCNPNDQESNLKISKYDAEFLHKNGLLQFQIKAVEAVPLVLYALLRWSANPEICAVNCVTLGGDCDTTGAMVGAVFGCLHGTSWIPRRWYDNLENTWNDNGQNVTTCCNGFGLDLALYLGVELAKLDFVSHDKFVEKKQGVLGGVMNKMKNMLNSSS